MRNVLRVELALSARGERNYIAGRSSKARDEVKKQERSGAIITFPSESRDKPEKIDGLYDLVRMSWSDGKMALRTSRFFSLFLSLSRQQKIKLSVLQIVMRTVSRGNGSARKEAKSMEKSRKIVNEEERGRKVTEERRRAAAKTNKKRETGKKCGKREK